MWQPNTDAIDVITQLGEMGIKCALLTKAERADKQKEKIERADLLDLFHSDLVAIVRPMFDDASGKYMDIAGKAAALGYLSNRLDVAREPIYCVGYRVTDTEAAVASGSNAIYLLNKDGKYWREEKIELRGRVPHFVGVQLADVVTIAKNYHHERRRS